MTSDDIVPAADVQPQAQDTTRLEQKAEAAFALEQRILTAAQTAATATWDLAEGLYELQESGSWAHLGYDSLSEFLAQPGLGIKRTQFFRLTKMWRDLVIVRKINVVDIKAIEPSKVSEVVPAIMRGDVEVEDALEDAKELGTRDLREKYKGHESRRRDSARVKVDPDDPDAEGEEVTGEVPGVLSGGSPTDPDDEPLDAMREPERVQCEVCGSWVLKQDMPDVVIDEDGEVLISTKTIDDDFTAKGDRQ